ncbi:MAG TPA: DUF2127 domain-containing protein [Candidatus Dormibacteraeota bacterium]|nr:DUF2127 domain-containing protein [Candidatus Dormibacteraeota bacterium]
MAIETDVNPRRHYLARLWRELGRMGGEHDAFIKVIIVERILKSTILLAGAVGLLVAGHQGWLDQWGDYAENQLNLNVGHSLVVTLLFRALAYVGAFNHITIIATAGILYAALEGTEGVGLAMRRRWAEYLTVIATGILIPYEAYEVVLHATLFKVGALALNLAVVGYLGYRKRLFVGI